MSSSLDEGQVRLAIEALKQYVAQAEAEKKPDLLSDSKYVYFTGHYVKSRPPLAVPRRILLPHPLNEPADVEICLFTKETKPEVKKLLEEKGINNWIIKIIPVKKVETHFKTFERRKQLASMYNMYLADRRIINILRHKLGKAFMSKRGLPLPVNLLKDDLKSELHSAVTATHYRTYNSTTLMARFGKISMSASHLVDNAMALMKNIISHTPRGWQNIKVLYIKTIDSVALPVYNSLELAPPTKFEDDEREAWSLAGISHRKRLRNQHSSSTGKYSTKKIKGSRIANSKRKKF